MIDEIHRLADRGEDFGFETTLAGRAHLNLLAQLKPKGCVVHMFCFRPQKRRFRESGLAFGEADMMYRKRPFAGRFERSVENFLRLYCRAADNWILFDNSRPRPSMIAYQKGEELHIIRSGLYRELTSRSGPRS